MCLQVEECAFALYCPVKLLVSSEQVVEWQTLIGGLGINRLRAATLPVRPWTSFRDLGEGSLSSDLILSGFASIPRVLTMKPRNFPDATPKVHFCGLSLMPYSRSILKHSSRSETWLSAVFDLTSMSSTYTSMFFLIWSANILFTSLW